MVGGSNPSTPANFSVSLEPMTSDNQIGLSVYQRAILTHLGIVPWRLKSRGPEMSDKQRVQTASPLAQVTNTKKYAKPSQQQRAAGLEKLKEVVTTSSKSTNQLISIPDQVLIVSNDNNNSSLYY